MILTRERVRELFKYNETTGDFIRLVSRGGRALAGAVADNINIDGYLATMIDGKKYLNHRLVWFLVHGYFPENVIDHINRIRTDNRIENLREATQSCNLRNAEQRIDNTSGVKGVGWHKRDKKWQVKIAINGKVSFVGLHNDFTEAVAHRLAAEQCINWSSCDNNSPAYQYIKSCVGRVKP